MKADLRLLESSKGNLNVFLLKPHSSLTQRSGKHSTRNLDSLYIVISKGILWHFVCSWSSEIFFMIIRLKATLTDKCDFYSGFRASVDSTNAHVYTCWSGYF